MDVRRPELHVHFAARIGGIGKCELESRPVDRREAREELRLGAFEAA